MRRLRVAWKRSAPYAIPALVFLGVILALFWRLWTPLDGERKTFAWDAKYEYWGDLQFQLKSLAHGHLPLWNPYDRLGYPFYADPQTGTLYPLQWLIWPFAAITGAPWWIVPVKIMMHMELGALGLYWVCARRKLPEPARYLAGVSFLTSYPVLHNAFSALNWSYAWTPWIILALDAWAERPTMRRAAFVALSAAMGLLAGGMASFFYGALAAIPVGIVELVRHGREAARSARGREYLRAALRTGLAAAGLFLAVVAAQVLATRGLVPETVRDRRGVAFFGTTVFDAVDVIGFFTPRMQGENTYLGIGLILWIGALLVLKPTGRNLTLAGVFVLGALCAFGDRAPFLPLFASIVPTFGWFRRAHRYLYVGVVPIALLAAEGLALCATIADEQTRARVRRGLAIGAGLALAVCVIVFAIRATSTWKPDVIRDAFGFGAISALVAGWTTWMVLGRQGGHRRRFVVIAVVAAAIDLWFARSKVIDHPDVMQPPPRIVHDDLVRKPDLPIAQRIYDRNYLSCRPGTRLGVRDVGGYEGDPLALSRYEMVRGAIVAAPEKMRYVGVAHYYEGGGEDTLPKSGADLAVMKQVAPGQWELAGAMPSVVWFDAAELAPDAGAAVNAMFAAPPGAKAVLEAPYVADRARATKLDLPAATPVAGTLDDLTADSLRATIDAPADGVVVIDEMFYDRGWSATVDGADAEIMPADGYARAIFVGPGHHVIEMSFGAGGYYFFVIVEMLALGGIGFLIYRGRNEAAPVIEDGIGGPGKTPSWSDDDPETSVDAKPASS
ncbi:MAG TPA: hypothetical protein VL463_05670 [Kofleriaceae bacterium]|nr:hypothetical protein [Kofleriaceae bacterium]